MKKQKKAFRAFLALTLAFTLIPNVGSIVMAAEDSTSTQNSETKTESFTLPQIDSEKSVYVDVDQPGSALEVTIFDEDNSFDAYISYSVDYISSEGEVRIGEVGVSLYASNAIRKNDTTSFFAEKSGRYVIRIMNASKLNPHYYSGTNASTLKISYTVIAHDGLEPNNSQEQATELKAGAKTYFNLLGEKDEDWFGLYITDDVVSNLKITIGADSGQFDSSVVYRVSKYNESTGELETVGSVWGSYASSAFRRTLTKSYDISGAGMYYIRVLNASAANPLYYGGDNQSKLYILCETNIEGDYYYNAYDSGEDIVLPSEKLNTVTSLDSAVDAVETLTSAMNYQEKRSAIGADLATLYAEAAVSKVASKKVTGKEIIINKSAVQELESVSARTGAAVETALVNGGVTTARLIANVVTLTTDETGEITIKIDPDILETRTDKIRVETPTYAITLKVTDLEEDLASGVITITSEDVGSGFAPGNQNKKTTVKVNLPKGKITNPVTLSLPKDGDDTTYQAVVKADGSATSSKYNPATTTMDGKVNTSGSYTVQTNQKDFTDIANKSAEMQKAIRYLASKGIINGTSAMEFSPDGSINRAEIAALLVRALGKLDNSATNTFTDVKSSDWYYSAAGSSQKCGLINGYTDNTFRGTTAIAKDQILAVAARVLKNEMGYKEPSNPNSYLAKYSDTVTKWAQPEVALATKENLVVYRVDGTFKGESNMTRGDAAIIIYRLFQKIW